jgi:5-methylthioadenosine/S-adenosylhomocysteine deaminase
MDATLFEGGTIITMDHELGDLVEADLLVEGDRIAAIGPKLAADGAQRIDARGRIIIPGLVNAHMHTWQTGLRGLASNWTLLQYFRNVHRGLATLFEPEDLFYAELLGGWNQIDCGTTTLGDWCHNNPTPEHTDAALDGLIRSRVRAVFIHGSPKPDPKPGQPHFSEVPHPRGEVERLLAGPLADREGRVTLALGILGPHYSTLDVSLHDFRLARELGLVASMHQGGGEAKTPGGWDVLEQEGLVGEGVNIVHGHGLSDDQIARFSAAGVSFSTTPENEMTQGHGFPITGKVRAAGGLLSLGVDLESVLSGDMFTVARMALGMQRALDNDASRRETGAIPETSTITTREALGWITIDGARALGIDARIGSLTPGKQADVTVLRADELNLWPVHDPVSTVVMQAGPRNVESVMIAGEFLKRSGQLQVGEIDAPKRALAASGQRIAGELRRREQEGY